MADERLLSIYLNDHLAGAVLGCELTARGQRSNEGTELGAFLATLLRDLAEDRGALEEVMDRLGVARSRPKQVAAWTAEKLGRLKLNGRIRGYSPLSRLVELEGLALGVRGKLALWRSLELVSGTDERLRSFDFARLAERAEAQATGLEEWRRKAAAEAFGATPEPRKAHA